MRVQDPLVWREDWPDRIRAAILASAIGDALGVPWEFSDKAVVRSEWRGEMRGGGTWGQPPGTWSDDTGQMLAVLHGLLNAGDGDPVEHVARELVRWYTGEAHTLGGPPFDMGATTSIALWRLLEGVPPDRSGVERESCGSLMRNIPVPLYTLCTPLPEALELAHRISRITHAHPVAEMACGLHLVIARSLMAGHTLEEAIAEAARALREYYQGHPRYSVHVHRFRYLEDPALLDREPPEGSCWVDETLQGALWALKGAGSLREAIVRAVGLGGDTDTLGAIVGGLAGIIYGTRGIPQEWLEPLRGRSLLEEAADKLITILREKCKNTGNASGA